MKRSEINACIKEAEEFFASFHFYLPAFSKWTVEDWEKNREKCDEITSCALGWDVTDFGSGDFLKTGLLLFTIRNGVLHSEKYTKPYAEKIMLVKPGQVTPMHCHYRKQEDIINRGGGKLVFQLAPAENNKPVQGKVHVVKDGLSLTVDSRETVILEPGESLTLVPGAFHTFHADPSSGSVMVGEVSSVNDDNLDNCFAEKRERFQKWEEDTPPERLTVSDYTDFFNSLSNKKKKGNK